VIVLTGIYANMIYLNDPDGGVKRVGTVPWFNTKLSNSLHGCLQSAGDKPS
jgi:hypothetical protein